MEPRTRWKTAALFFIVAIALTIRTITFDFVWDDQFQIADNPAVTQGVPLSKFLLDASTTSARPDYNERIYRPLRNVVFRGLAATFGLRPIVYRSAGIVIYACCAALVFLLALRLFSEPIPAVVCAAFWVLLPVHVEVSSYPSAIGDGLSLVLTLGAVLAALSSVEPQVGRLRSLTWGILSLGLSFSAMCAKEMAVTQPLVVFVTFLFFHRLQKRGQYLVAATSAVAIGFLMLRTHVIGRIGQEDSTFQTFGNGLLIAPVALVNYVGLMLLPLGHRISYLFPPTSWFMFLAASLLVTVALVVFWWLDRNRPTKIALYGLAWTILTLAPVLHLVPSWTFMADRFALVPSVGLSIFLGAIYQRAAAKRLRIQPVLALLLLAYAGGTMLEQSKWRNNYELYEHDVQSVPGSAMAQSNFCTVLLQSGDAAKAAIACQRAIDLGLNQASAHLRKAVALLALGQPAQAESNVRAAIALEPKSTAAWAALGNLRVVAGDLDGAQTALVTAEQYGKHPNLLILRAELATARGERAQAFRAFEELLRVSTSVARMHFKYAEAALKLGDTERAIEQAQSCLRLDPTALPCVELLRGLGKLGPQK